MMGSKCLSNLCFKTNGARMNKGRSQAQQRESSQQRKRFWVARLRSLDYYLQPKVPFERCPAVHKGAFCTQYNPTKHTPLNQSRKMFRNVMYCSE